MHNTYSAYHAQRRAGVDRILRNNAPKPADDKPVETFAEYKARKAAERKNNPAADDDDGDDQQGG